MIKVEVHATRAVIREQEPLTVGLRGVQASFVFGSPWTQLIKTAVFRQGDKTVTVADIGEEVTVPWEVMTQPGMPVQIGVYGTDTAGQLAIPTLWAETEPVYPGADPAGDSAAEPSPALWEQLQSKLGRLEQLETEDKTDLVAAINEANRPVRQITVRDNGDGTYRADCKASEIQTMLNERTPVACYWLDKDVMLYLSEFQRDCGPYLFTAVCQAVEYCVIVSDDDVHCSVTKLAKNGAIPRKTSQLENDSGFLTEVPVTGVNGQTGDITVPTPVKVTVTEEDGKYWADRSCTEILALHNAGNVVYCQMDKLVLSLVMASKAFCSFHCIHGGNLHTVQIGTSTVTVTVTPMTSSEAAADAVRYTPQELTAEQQAQARQNIGALSEDELPDSGGSTFHFKMTLEKASSGFRVEFPVNWENLLRFNMHVYLPGGASTDMVLQADVSGNSRGMTTLTTGNESFNIHAMYYFSWSGITPVFAMSITQSKSPEHARPAVGNSTLNGVVGKNYFGIYTTTADATFPVGTIIDVWGLHV